MNSNFDFECTELSKILKQKQQRYGNSYEKTADEYGNKTLVLRIEDKVNRAKVLVKNLEEKKDDAELASNLIDTFIDIAGYGVLAVKYLKEKQKTEPENPPIETGVVPTNKKS